MGGEKAPSEPTMFSVRIWQESRNRSELLCVSVVLAAAAAAEARDFVVGGANDGGWKAQAQPDALTKWASANRFQVGDNRVFKLDGAADSVLEVTRDDSGADSCPLQHGQLPEGRAPPPRRHVQEARARPPAGPRAGSCLGARARG
ncbi:hypothetical protein BAE44_0011301 [Dichanthelium oligosanthes]|uniref:Phytocyanin domain-containing protein n=1 Tax=Dichanthelium oligosanthes TaxID=888268 RepID=A0A1E5VRC8_9POAL|nr:hypothetical protein BAE44_0011301 [Dichanthelium oligosanthes]